MGKVFRFLWGLVKFLFRAAIVLTPIGVFAGWVWLAMHDFGVMLFSLFILSGFGIVAFGFIFEDIVFGKRP